MSKRLYTVQDLLDETRSLIDESNRDSVDDVVDLLPSLNRGLDYAFDIYARRYPEPILTHAFFPLVGGQAEYDIPDEVFEDRVQKIEIQVPSGPNASDRATFREITAASYRDISDFESSSQTNFPYYYTIFGRKIRFVPTPSGTYGARIWYLVNPEKLKQPQGRITVVNSAQNYVVVDSAGDGLTTEADQLGSYINFVDGQTGVIKGSAQIQLLPASNKVVIRGTPFRDVVLGRTIDGTLPSDLAPDDYISPIDGTCVPYFGKPTSNFLIQYASCEMIRKLGGNADAEDKVLDKFEKQVERSYSRRPQTQRVKKRSQIWGIPTRRFYWE